MPTRAARQDERAAQPRPAAPESTIATQKSEPKGGSKPPRSPRKRYLGERKRLRGTSYASLAFGEAMEFIEAALACQRVTAAGTPAWRATGQPGGGGVEAQIVRRLQSVPTVEQLRSYFTPDELTNLASELNSFLDKRASELLAGLGDGARKRYRDRTFRYVEQSLASMSHLPCTTGELPCNTVERLIERERKLAEELAEKSKELGRPALISDLGPRELVFPSQTKLRAAAASHLSMNERDVRRLEKREIDEGLVARISDLVAERIPKNRGK